MAVGSVAGTKPSSRSTGSSASKRTAPAPHDKAAGQKFADTASKVTNGQLATGAPTVNKASSPTTAGQTPAPTTLRAPAGLPKPPEPTSTYGSIKADAQEERVAIDKATSARNTEIGIRTESKVGKSGNGIIGKAEKFSVRAFGGFETIGNYSRDGFDKGVSYIKEGGNLLGKVVKEAF